MDLIDELIDRFGDLPPTVETLLEVSLLRNTLASYGFSEISQKAQSLQLIPESFRLETAQKLMAGLRGRVLVNASSHPYLTVRLGKSRDVVETLQEIAAALSAS